MKYADWLTKEQAADRIGVSVKTVERMADKKELQQKFRPRPGGTPLAVFNPADVERAASERAAADGRPYIMPDNAVIPAPAPPAGPPAIRPHQDIDMPAIARRAAFLGAPPLWLRIDEAVMFSGLGESRLREMIDAGQVRTERGPRGSVVLNRADLERHAASLSGQ